MIDYKTGDRPSELLERAIALFLPQMDADERGCRKGSRSFELS
ncbi:hypothetical protein [Microcoleus sp.]